MNLKQFAKALRRAAFCSSIYRGKKGDISGTDKAQPVMKIQRTNVEMQVPPS